MGLPIDEIVQRRAYNAAADLVDGNVARGLGGKVAFTDPERTLTYGELQARSCQFARALKTLGIRQESRVALLLLDTVDFPVAFFGAIRAGIVALPLNILLTEAQYAYVLTDSRACAIVVQAPLAKPIAAIIDRLPELTHRDPGRRDAGRQGGVPEARRASVRRHSGARERRALRRRDQFRRGRVLDVHLGLDRRSQGREARADHAGRRGGLDGPEYYRDS